MNYWTNHWTVNHKTGNHIADGEPPEPDDPFVCPICNDEPYLEEITRFDGEEMCTRCAEEYEALINHADGLPVNNRSRWPIIIGIAVVTVATLMLMTCSAMAVDMEKIAQIESSGNPQAYNPKSGCIGLYQINPKGALVDWNRWHPDDQYYPDDLYDPEVNYRVAYWYLHDRIPAMLRYYGYNPDDLELILTAYNCGIGCVTQGRMPRETRNYVEKYKQMGE